jgi:thymidylate synthase
VADRLDIAVGHLTFIIKSAHVYEAQLDAMRETVTLAATGGTPPDLP